MEDAAYEKIKNQGGMYVGMLDDDELECFDLLCSVGRASRDYEHAGGLLGLAKVKLHHP